MKKYLFGALGILALAIIPINLANSDGHTTSKATVRLSGKKPITVINDNTPVQPINNNALATIGAGDLYVAYASELNFSPIVENLAGKKSKESLVLKTDHTLYPASDQVLLNNKQINVNPFVQVHSVSDAHVWCASVIQTSEFKTADGETLPNAQLKVSTTDDNLSGTELGATANTRGYNNQAFADANAMCMIMGEKTTAAGDWTNTFGNKNNSKRNYIVGGFSLDIPAGTTIVNKQYQAELTWVMNDVPLVSLS
ncbi:MULTISPECIES: WxL domain-containing protein [Leuconostoc]|jgi:hypothetical protein|uniref:WxL domain-containing protein n=1 Tax=Leuconostoc pseudomesenteroides TaxID=33968 RepID=A0A5B8SXE7_LEUPS|nr:MULTISPECIES: WxL domain-containing protein [Leuconostoc]MCC7669228.1 hypothetical protein [Leuconostoc pseudomesenteroides]MDG9734208.1 WxL domain-containing protein [Leuconostoc pseudomesenteroides]MDN2451586.1 hypothetical protein [Leuconostoc sp. UCMA20149]NKZ36437.1 hypothetical protein [Leuconostoc pseudomesenteroides]QEA41356.1 hypothetical protein FGL85_01870 [Leuconostoc pseudomesenteroides]